ncbi:unnamed protein product [Euphydryas editha]|uniref:Uncharacterized protein n=1 Tax=Euphydryas editha TaxID=104508 RepID=A0AAU9TYV2_EUPED|nr:unnamed protein product [Euphydryas editha]
MTEFKSKMHQCPTAEIIFQEQRFYDRTDIAIQASRTRERLLARAGVGGAHLPAARRPVRLGGRGGRGAQGGGGRLAGHAGASGGAGAAWAGARPAAGEAARAHGTGRGRGATERSTAPRRRLPTRGRARAPPPCARRRRPSAGAAPARSARGADAWSPALGLVPGA